jgi:hypothetical protein
MSMSTWVGTRPASAGAVGSGGSGAEGWGAEGWGAEGWGVGRRRGMVTTGERRLLVYRI